MRLRRFFKTIGLPALIVSLAIAFGVAIFLTQWEASKRELQVTHNRLLSDARSIIDQQVGDIHRTIRLLENTITTNHSPVTDENERIERQFSTLMSSFDNLLQLRLLNLAGKELVKVVNESGQPNIIPTDKLQDKSHRYYYKESIANEPQEVYLSPIDLNTELNEIVLPYQPTLRAVSKVIINNDQHVLLVINYDLTETIEAMSDLSTSTLQLVVLNANGEWVVAPVAEEQWQPAIASSNLQLILPEVRTSDWFETRERLDEQTLHTDKSGNLFSTESVYLNRNEQRKDDQLFIISVTHSNDIQRLQIHTLVPSLLVIALLLTLAYFIWQKEAKYRRRLGEQLARIRKKEKYLRRLHREQRLMQDEIVENRKLSALGMTVAGVAHELNTPLGGAIMSVSSMDSDIQDIHARKESENLTKSQFTKFMQRQRKGCELAFNNLQQCANLVSSFKRLAIDRHNEDIVDFTLNTLIDDLLAALTPMLKKHQVSIEYSPIEEIELRGLPGIVSQIMQNLILNAMHHAFVPSKSGKIYINAEVLDGMVNICVSDDGKGIDADIQNRLFEPFITTGRGKGHTGLGLYLVRQWVTKLLFGKIDVQSSDQGTTFSFSVRQTLTSNRLKKMNF